MGSPQKLSPHHCPLRAGCRPEHLVAGGGGFMGRCIDVLLGIWFDTGYIDVIQIPGYPPHRDVLWLSNSHCQPPKGAEDLVKTVMYIGAGGRVFLDVRPLLLCNAAILVFVAETWVETPCIGHLLGLFRHRLARRFLSKQPWRREDGT